MSTALSKLEAKLHSTGKCIVRRLDGIMVHPDLLNVPCMVSVQTDEQDLDLGYICHSLVRH